MSLFGSKDNEQSTTVEQLLADAASDYEQHNSPETQAAAREQSGQIRTNGNANAGFRWGR